MKRLCVFCGSRGGVAPAYAEVARDLGQKMAHRGLGLVFGGGHVGLMGAIADAVLQSGGEVIGVIPQGLVDRELAHRGCTQLHITRTMHERKALMADLSDAFVALPGGYGTLDETFEMLTWAQLGLHAKPVGVLNVNGYFGALLAFLDHTVREGFIKPAHRQLLRQAASADELLEVLSASPSGTDVEKWDEGEVPKP
jgi:uncharacterized protein (TIGR00730 family)